MLAGVTSDESWKWCFKSNATFLDCPINNYPGGEVNMIVAVHNPAALTFMYPMIKVPHAHYDVKGFNYTTLKFETVPATALCNNISLQNSQKVYTCDLFIEYNISASSLGFISISYNAETDVSAKFYNKGSPVIENDYESLTYYDYFTQVGAMFKLHKKNHLKTYTFNFDIRYWPSYQLSGQKSGVYIFRPEDDVHNSFRFTTLKEVTY
jgi:hypothetical protein